MDAQPKNLNERYAELSNLEKDVLIAFWVSTNGGEFGITVDWVGAITDLQENQVLSNLDSLVDKDLMQKDGQNGTTMYTMPGEISNFINENYSGDLNTKVDF